MNVRKAIVSIVIGFIATVLISAFYAAHWFDVRVYGFVAIGSWVAFALLWYHKNTVARTLGRKYAGVRG